MVTTDHMYLFKFKLARVATQALGRLRQKYCTSLRLASVTELDPVSRKKKKR